MIIFYVLNVVNKMKTLLLSVRVRDTSYVATSLMGLQAEGHNIETKDFDYGDIDTDAESLMQFLNELEDADILFIWVSGNLEYFKNHRLIMKKANSVGVPVFVFNADRERAEQHRDIFPFSDEDYNLLYRYSLMGGGANFRAIGLWMLNRFEGENNILPESYVPPAQGVYSPGCTDTSFETHLG